MSASVYLEAQLYVIVNSHQVKESSQLIDVISMNVNEG